MNSATPSEVWMKEQLEAFEAWFASLKRSGHKRPNRADSGSGYFTVLTQYQWEAWQAAALATRPLQVVPESAALPHPAAPQGWQDIATAPKDGRRYIHVQQQATFRWLPYKPASEQHRKGIKGRWQKFNGYGWDNAELEGFGWKDALIAENGADMPLPAPPGAAAAPQEPSDAQMLDWLEAKCTGASDSERYLPFRLYWGSRGHQSSKSIRAVIAKAMKASSTLEAE